MLKKNFFSILVALIILYLSLASSETFSKVHFINIPHIDKIIHFLMYSGLMSVIIFENRKLVNSKSRLMLVALIPFFYGILMEILQTTITTSRSGSIFDVMANSAGIIISSLLWWIIKPHLDIYFR